MMYKQIEVFPQICTESIGRFFHAIGFLIRAGFRAQRKIDAFVGEIKILVDLLNQFEV